MKILDQKSIDKIVELYKLNKMEAITVDSIRKFPELLAKIGLEIEPLTNRAEKIALRTAQKDRVVSFLKEFVGKLKHPKGVGDFFPYEELAIRLIDTFETK